MPSSRAPAAPTERTTVPPVIGIASAAVAMFFAMLFVRGVDWAFAALAASALMAAALR